MPSKQFDNKSLDLPLNPLSTRIGDVVAAPGSGITRGRRHVTDDERYIQDKLVTDLAVQRGVVIKAEHGEHLADILTRRTANRFVDYVAFDREIMDRPQSNDVDREHVDQFCMQTRRSHSASLFAMRQTSVNKLEEMVMTPLDPPEDKGDSVIIEQKPGILGALFGGSKVTTVKR